jgi:hypothetical protein
MQVLFNPEWDILPDHEDEYSEFVAQRFIPQCNDMGLCSVGGYYVEAGPGPRIISVKRAESMEQLGQIISSSRFRDLIFELKEHVTNYRSKILRPTGRTRDVPYTIQKGVWKYNQYWDIRPGRRQQYADFIVNEYVPMIESLDYVDLTGGWNVVIGGISEIVSEFTFKDPVDIGVLFDNPTYREMTHRLKRDFIQSYTSRILKTTERFDEPRWFAL